MVSSFGSTKPLKMLSGIPTASREKYIQFNQINVTVSMSFLLLPHLRIVTNKCPFAEKLPVSFLEVGVFISDGLFWEKMGELVFIILLVFFAPSNGRLFPANTRKWVFFLLSGCFFSKK